MGDTSDEEPSSLLSHTDKSYESDSIVSITSSDRQNIDLSDFAQLKFWKCRFVHAQPYSAVTYAAVVVGTILLLMGGIAVHFSENASQFRVIYSESPDKQADPMSRLWSQFPVGTRDIEKIWVNCSSSAERPGFPPEAECRVNLTIPKHMHRPLMYYAVGPYYQNYNSYMKSELIRELMGKPVTQDERKRRCIGPTREDSDNERIVPCGMKAVSYFNDTFDVIGYDVLKTKGLVAWTSDVDRYKNPTDYPEHPAGTSWLYERYPDSITEENGVRTPSFADWMRPSAVPRVWNRYGFVNYTFEQGDTLSIVIHSRYPISTIPGGYKVLVLTDWGKFGARHSGFGWILVSLGAFSYLLGVGVVIIFRLCPRGGLPCLQRQLDEDDINACAACGSLSGDDSS